MHSVLISQTKQKASLQKADYSCITDESGPTCDTAERMLWVEIG